MNNTIKRIEGAAQATPRNNDPKVLFDSRTNGDVSAVFDVEGTVWLRAFNFGDNTTVVLEMVYSQNGREFTDAYRVGGKEIGLTRQNNMIRLEAKGRYRIRALEFGQMLGDAAVVLVS